MHSRKLALLIVKRSQLTFSGGTSTTSFPGSLLFLSLAAVLPALKSGRKKSSPGNEVEKTKSAQSNKETVFTQNCLRVS